MRLLIFLIFFSISSQSQTTLQFGKVLANDISTCKESLDGKICQSKHPLEIWITRTTPLVGKEEMIKLTFNGFIWKAKSYERNLFRNSIDSFNLRPLYNYDTIFTSLRKNNVFLLPHEKELQLKNMADDGYRYILTFKADDKFRTYEFSNPEINLMYNSHISELRDYINITTILFKWLTKT